MKFTVSNLAVKQALIAMSVSIALVGCAANNNVSKTTSPVAAPQASQLTESQKIQTLAENYFDESMALNPVYSTFMGETKYNDQFNEPLSDKVLAKHLALDKKYLAAVNQIDPSKLRGQDLLSYEILKRDLEVDIRGYELPEHLMPISQFGGVHSYFAMLGSGSSAQPFNNAQDYRNFMKRSEGFAAYMDSVITTMQEGIKAGVVHPKPIIRKLVPQLKAHVVDDVSKSVFYGPVAALDDNENISEEEKATLKSEYIAVIEQIIIPAYDKVATFVEGEYLENGRDSVGLSALPNGKKWYEYRIETNTTLPLTAQEIHEFGKQEVARILSEMVKVKETVGFEGDLPAFFEFLRTDDQFYFDSKQGIIDGYTEVKEKINQKLPLLFEVFPKADYVVKPVEAYREASEAGASYMPPSPDGSRPGIFYINTRDLKGQPKFSLETLSIHEAAPGHHFQIAIQQEVEGLPKFRKFGGYTVFAEGWALYAESLGKELGLFTDPYMWYGRLSDEQLRAMRLVVDTGLHAFGWTREQAIDFMLENSSMAKSDVVAEVERYISIGGQALAYKIGQRHIRMLRNKASAALGDKFDVRKFHTQVLIDGALPMPILEAKIDRWIESQKS
ncbi:DUF885 domain-containing protein [Aliiglaciecola sp. 3_MG-2023]|uniref:DUF885 domain-containing protein n=1 Tax=Aliiglaciecola sp. 3_MG-2023 TaxID=3062644 RepID=UPI0026E132A6|nr:DUF885 domain-containing protein [Aliiglaciecola sp. 3_MG-2023]MDO6692399.1 DUF885 domain-containing protein [Aliiglaciecola sp. 3_MG-2023]